MTMLIAIFSAQADVRNITSIHGTVTLIYVCNISVYTKCESKLGYFFFKCILRTNGTCMNGGTIEKRTILI